MSFEVFPQIVEVFPNDERLFEARAALPPPMWKVIDQAGNKSVLQPDHSILRSLIGSYEPLGEGVFHLVSGIGSIEWTLDLQCLPTSGVGKEFVLIAILDRPGGTDWIYRVEIQNANIEVRSESALLTTLAITPAVGMKVKIEIASGFRLFIDGVLRHERISLGANVAYPAIYRATILGNAPASQLEPGRIPPPALEGDWRLQPLDLNGNPIVEFSVEHGSLSAGANALQKIYSGGTVPGQYKLKATISPGIFIWVEDAAPTGSTVSSTGGSWVWGTGSPTQFSGSLRLKSPLAASAHVYTAQGATDTMQVNKDDVLTCYVFLDATDPPSTIQLAWKATDATAFEHRAYWGADQAWGYGVNGTASRRFMGALPATNQWVKLEVPASLVDFEGRVANGISFELWDGVCSFDQAGKYPGKLQYAESIITIPPLKILGDLVRTMQPDSLAILQTNYDDSQTGPSLVTWSKISGAGTISGNQFTAQNAPGANVLRASSTGNQVQDLTVNVPPVITPSFAFAAPLEQIDFGTNITSPTWSSVPSGINSSTGVITFPNTHGLVVKITVTDGTFTATRDVLIMKKFPIGRFATPMEGERRKKVLISEAEDGTDVSRVKNKDGLARDYYSVQIKNLIKSEFETIQAFHDEYYPAKPFIFEDVPRGIRMMAKFDSDLAWRGGPGRFDIAFRVRQAVM